MAAPRTVGGEREVAIAHPRVVARSDAHDQGHHLVVGLRRDVDREPVPGAVLHGESGRGQHARRPARDVLQALARRAGQARGLARRRDRVPAAPARGVGLQPAVGHEVGAADQVGGEVRRADGARLHVDRLRRSGADRSGPVAERELPAAGGIAVEGDDGRHPVVEPVAGERPEAGGARERGRQLQAHRARRDRRDLVARDHVVVHVAGRAAGVRVLLHPELSAPVAKEQVGADGVACRVVELDTVVRIDHGVALHQHVRGLVVQVDALGGGGATQQGLSEQVAARVHHRVAQEARLVGGAAGVDAAAVVLHAAGTVDEVVLHQRAVLRHDADVAGVDDAVARDDRIGADEDRRQRPPGQAQHLIRLHQDAAVADDVVADRQLRRIPQQGAHRPAPAGDGVAAGAGDAVALDDVVVAAGCVDADVGDVFDQHVAHRHVARRARVDAQPDAVHGESVDDDMVASLQVDAHGQRADADGRRRRRRIGHPRVQPLGGRVVVPLARGAQHP